MRWFSALLLTGLFCGCAAQSSPPVRDVPATSATTIPAAEIQSAPGIDPPTGYVPNPEGTQQFLKSLERPELRQAAPDLFSAPMDGKRSDVFLYRALHAAHKKRYGRQWEVGKQGIGDCVSWGWMHGLAIASAVEFMLGHATEWDMPATEPIYGGSRVEARGQPGDGARPYGGYSDGSYGAAAARWVHERGGVLYRKKYEPFDLSDYSASRAKEWGAYGCGGKNDGGKADTLAAAHPVKHVALVRSFDEAAAAITSGYPVPVCSMQGFTNRRDSQGFDRPGPKPWAHCMCFVAVRFDRPGLLCLNSWGPTIISGPKWPEDQPEGSFWVDAAIATKMLSGAGMGGPDSFAVSAADGFPRRKLDNQEWVACPPPIWYAVAP